MSSLFDFEGTDLLKNENINGIIKFRLGYNPLMDWMFSGNVVNKPDNLRFRRLMTYVYYLTQTVSEYGIQQGFSGYSYILDAVTIFYLYDSNELVLSSDVYPIIAKKYQANVNNIEHNIRNAIIDAFNRSRSVPGSNKMILFETKPGNRDFLIHITDLMRMKMAMEFCTEQT
jgi:hypothetical protein